MLNSIKNILKILVLGLLLCNIVFAGTLTEELKELNRMYQAGFLTKDEFIKAKSILLDEESLSESKKIPVEKVEDLPNIKKLEKLYKSGLLTKEQYTKAKSILQKKIELQKSKSQNIQIRKFKPNFNKKEFEKMEMIVGDYRFYTHRPGGIKVRRISDGKQLLVLGDNFKTVFYNDGKDIFNLDVDKKNLKLSVKANNARILYFEGKYIKKYRAHFYQVLAIGPTPFHYYIVLGNGKSVALNINKFTKRIDKAVKKAKIKIAQKHGITLEQIELIIKRRDLKASRELENIVKKTQDDVLREESEKALDRELAYAVGKEMAEQFNVALEQAGMQAMDQALQNELATVIDEAIAEAVSMGISAAAVAAGIEAWLDVLAAGGTEQEAWDAGCAAAGQAQGC